MSGLRDHSCLLVLEELVGLELPNSSRQLKMKPGVNDKHQVIMEMPNELSFSGMEVEEEEDKSQNAKKRKHTWKLRFCERNRKQTCGST